MKSFFFPFVLALIVVGTIDGTLKLASPTPSELMMAAAVVAVFIAVLGIVAAAASGVSAPKLSTLTKDYCLFGVPKEEDQRRREASWKEINWWDSEHIAVGYLGG